MGNGVAEARAAQGRPAAADARADSGGVGFIATITESWLFKNFILLCIIVNAAILGYDAHFGPNNPHTAEIAQANTIFLGIFTAELVLEFMAQGFQRYVRSGWNWFDVVIVAASWLAAAPGVTALRAFRVIRVFRLVSNVPQMQRVVEALVRAMPGIFATMMVLAIVYYIAAIMATTLFGQRFPEMFGDLGKSGLILFQLTLFDDWGAIVSSVGEVYPWAWAFFLVFTVLSAFAVLNLFIGVIVDAVQEARSAELKKDVSEIGREVDKIEDEVEDIAEAQEDAAAMQKSILDEMRALRAEMTTLRQGGPPAG